MTENKIKENTQEISLYKYIDIITQDYKNYLKKILEKNQDIKETEVPILVDIYEKDQVNQEYLANKFKYTTGHTSKILSDFEKSGLITRHENPQNRRKKIITLTKKGQKEALKYKKMIDIWEKNLTKTRTQKQVKTLKQELRNICINCKTEN